MTKQQTEYLLYQNNLININSKLEFIQQIMLNRKKYID